MLESYDEQTSKELGKHKQFNRYYHWVGVAFIVQALLFCLPACLWVTYETRVRGQRCELEKILFLEQPKKTGHPEKRGQPESRFDRIRRHLSQPHSIYVLLEISNLLIVLGQFELTNLFLNGRFNSYGLRFMQAFQSIKFIQSIQWHIWDMWNFWNPTALAFPKLAKCVLKKPASSFSLFRYLFSRNREHDEYICRLPLNYEYEAIYVLVWFWFAMLLIIDVCNLIFRSLEALWFSFYTKPNQSMLPVCQAGSTSNKPVNSRPTSNVPSKISLKASSRTLNVKVKVENLGTKRLGIQINAV